MSQDKRREKALERAESGKQGGKMTCFRSDHVSIGNHDARLWIGEERESNTKKGGRKRVGRTQSSVTGLRWDAEFIKFMDSVSCCATS